MVDRTWENINPTFSYSLGSTLLLIEKDTNDPLHLWVITDSDKIPSIHFRAIHVHHDNLTNTSSQVGDDRLLAVQFRDIMYLHILVCGCTDKAGLSKALFISNVY